MNKENSVDLPDKPSYDDLLKRVNLLEKELNEMKGVDEIIQHIIKKTGLLTGIDFIKSLAGQIGTLLGFKYVLIGRLLTPDKDKVETLAFWCDGRLEENIIYNLQGTPCETVTSNKVCFYPDNIQAEFPTDKDLATLGAKSYLGVPLVGKSGKTSGLLAAMHDEPMKNVSIAKYVMASFTIRALAEIERIVTEETLKENEIRYRRLIESSPDIVYIFSSKRGTLYCSDRIKDILGYSSSYIYQNPLLWNKSIHPDNQADVQSAINGFHKGKDFNIEYRIIDSKGDWHWFWDRFIGKEIKEDEIIIEGLATDITERKKTEEALLLAKNEAENATLTKDKFVSLVAHDLRGPVGSIARLLDIVLHNKGLSLPNEQEKFIKIASGSAKRLEHMIDDLLNINRFKHKSRQHNLRFTNPYTAVLNAINIYELIANQKGVKIANRLTDKDMLFTDGMLLEQVISNIIYNAVKFSKTDDVVTIFNPGDNPFNISVSDTGTGIHPNILADIFSYEKKTSLTGTDGEVGSGFGLPLSQEIMKGLGGEIKVESAVGAGSTFTIKLPEIKPKILIVDDEDIFRFELSHYLKDLNVDIVEAVHGEDALKKIRQGKPHLIITDISMPVMDGTHLIKQLKMEPDISNIPVIVATAIVDMAEKDKSFHLDADDFIIKPFEPSELIPRVKWFLW